MIVRRATLDDILALRHAELRPGLPLETARFDGDDEPATVHVAAFDGDDVVGCASFMQRSFEDAPAFQLRGMATRADRRGRGIGAAVLAFGVDAVRATLLWCNARIAAVPFYEGQRWTVVSDEFDIPTVGPHRVMMRECAPGAPPATS
ncbi:MAG TPA: GNAT family N-acetyltransferase [Candidatus Binatia bacterium]|nr:GNAT family N-acetyltransferase [Candidatus Binatia bacterium]